MEVVKDKQNEEKLQTCSNDSFNETDSSKEKGTLLGLKGDGNDRSDHKRKSKELNDDGIRAKHLKHEKVKREDNIVASGNNSSNDDKNVQRPTLSTKDTGIEYGQGCNTKISNKTKSSEPKGNERKDGLDGKKKEKVGINVKDMTDDRKRKTLPNNSDQHHKLTKSKASVSDRKGDERKELPDKSFSKKEKTLVKANVKSDHKKKQNSGDKHQNSERNYKKIESGPSPPKMKKVEKESKNMSKKSSKVDMKTKSTSGKTLAKKSKGKEKAKEPSGDMIKINEDDPMSMLMMMEGSKGKQLGFLPPAFGSQATSSSASLDKPAADKDKSIDEMMDSDDSDWEDVKDHTLPMQGENSQLPPDPVQIILEMPDDPNTKKRKKKEFDMKKHLEKIARKFNREVATNIHKSHILCLMAHGLRQNTILNDEIVNGICLSLLPAHLSYLSRTSFNTEKIVESAMAWYRTVFPLKRVNHTSGSKLISVNSIINVMSKRMISDSRMWVYVFIIVLRTLQLSVRLVVSLQPIPFKVVQESSIEDPTASSSKAQWSSKTSTKTESKPPPPAPQKATAKYSSDIKLKVANTNIRKQELKIKSNRKILSESEDDEVRAHDFWLEVFSSSKKRWTCFDCFKNVFDKPYVLEKRATQPISYVVAFRNDNGVKDVTPRYAKQWLSLTRKIRVDVDWLEQTFSMFGKATYQETIEEEDHIKGQLLVRPMPATVGEFKNHPFYALMRHLLKNEAIYPETAIPLGYIKKEPVYARECVRTLRSKHQWLKEGRLVRLKEEPYKMGKSRPTMFQKQTKQRSEELDLELFGEWQTEKFIPLPAFNGKIPKNEYGNVELFKPWMLPSGTVLLKLQGLQKVAKKLNIDVAPAMVGWDHHGGRAHPIFDGFVACEEHVDVLLEAWDEDQEVQQQKEDEKREKRIYGNWRLLIRGMLIKERLKNKFLKEAPALLDEEVKQDSSGPSSSTAVKQQSDKIQEKKTDLNTKKKKKKKNVITDDDTDDSD